MTRREQILNMTVGEFYNLYCKEHYENEEEKARARNIKGQFSDMSAFALFVCAMLDCHNCPKYSDDDFTLCECYNLDKWLDEELNELEEKNEKALNLLNEMRAYIKEQGALTKYQQPEKFAAKCLSYCNKVEALLNNTKQEEE